MKHESEMILSFIGVSLAPCPATHYTTVLLQYLNFTWELLTHDYNVFQDKQ